MSTKTPHNLFNSPEQSFTKSTVDAQDDRTACILNAQTQFAAIDATTIKAYVIVVLRDEEDGDGFFTTVSAAGTRRDKHIMADALLEAMEKGEAE